MLVQASSIKRFGFIKLSRLLRCYTSLKAGNRECEFGNENATSPQFHAHLTPTKYGGAPGDEICRMKNNEVKLSAMCWGDASLRILCAVEKNKIVKVVKFIFFLNTVVRKNALN